MLTLQRAIEGVETELGDFKETCRKEFEALNVDEGVLTGEITQLALKFESWETAPVAETRPKTVTYTSKVKETDPHKLEVLRLDREIQELGGATLGWDDDDHKEFMKLRTQYKLKQCPAFFRDAANLLPMYSQEAIEDHCEKHDILQRLTLKKKNLLIAWREARLKTAEQADDYESPPKPKQKPRRPESADAKQRVEEWRKAQAEAKLKTEDRHKKELEKRKNEAAAARTAEQHKKKQLVAEFKERKEFEKFHRDLVDNYTKKRSTLELTDEDRERLRLREDKLLQKKLQLNEAKAQAEQQRRIKDAENKLRTEASWAYVDSRLQQETTAFIKRKEDKKPVNRADSFAGQLIRTTGRAVPSWRGGLSR
jgi:hypothetical protein